MVGTDGCSGNRRFFFFYSIEKVMLDKRFVKGSIRNNKASFICWKGKIGEVLYWVPLT